MDGKGEDVIVRYVTGERWMGKRTWFPTRSDVARLAYRLYEARGRQEGHDVEDWLRAEQELTR